MFSPLQVEVQPSVIARYLFLLLTALSFFSVWLSGLSFIYQLILSLACCCYLIYCWPRAIKLTDRNSVTALRWLAERKAVVVCLGDGDWIEVEAIEQRLNFPLLLGLKLKLRGRRRSVSLLIWRDSVSADQFRKLRVLLRFAPPPVSASHN
ncbi:protein YgfX [uncultured Amphritea sp.]|uniref:protein YgfX n=1 Tax=Amphritea sp. TaxID=1872502 RepID=UPI00344B821B